jgi:uncharacterized membrane protein HdeD (DUF308 family)
MTLGILLIIGGLFAFVMSIATSLVSILFLGILLAVAGVLEIVAAFRQRHSGNFFVYFLAGLLTFAVGALMLYRPVVSLEAITFLIAGYLFASGLFRGITAVMDRYPRWGWDLAYAIVALALGLYIIGTFPISSLWVLGTVVSAEIVARGITIVAASWKLREIEHGHVGPVLASHTNGPLSSGS